MTHFITKSVSTMGLLVLTAFASGASANSYHHIEYLAQRVERNSKRLVSEARCYRHTREYRHLVDDARDMARLADDIQDLARRHGRLSHIASDLAALSRKFHHLEDLIDHIEHGVGVGYGHVHRPGSGVRELMCAIETDINDIHRAVRFLSQPGFCPTSPAVVRRPVAPAPSPWYGQSYRRPSSVGFGHSYSRGREISIGGGSSRMTFRF